MSIILKLDETVTDDSLPKMGEMIFEVNSNVNFTFQYITNNSTEYTARIIGDGNFWTNNTYTTSAGKTVTQSTGALYMSSGHYKVGITQKYLVRELGYDAPLANNEAVIFDCENLKYCDYNVAFHASHWNIKNFSGDNMSKCNFINASGAIGMEVDVAEFKKITNDLSSVNIGNTECYGDLVDAFGDKINLVLLASSANNTTGTYGAVCDAMYANGRTSGTMAIVTNDGAGVKTVTFTAGGWSAT